MEIFKENLLFNNFGEIYLGIQEDYITPKDVIEFCLDKKIKSLNKEIIVELIVYEHESKLDFLDLLQEISLKERKAIGKDWSIEKYLRLWKLEFLLRAKNFSNDLDKVLEKVYEYYYTLEFPSDWNTSHILLYSVNKYKQPISNKEIFKNLENHIKREIIFFKTKT